jgi:hypothetical protein
LARSTLNEFKTKAAEYYLLTKGKILDRIVHGNLIHADETRANIKGHLAYVWVLTNHKEVVYILAESREGESSRSCREVSTAYWCLISTAYTTPSAAPNRNVSSTSCAI